MSSHGLILGFVVAWAYSGIVFKRLPHHVTRAGGTLEQPRFETRLVKPVLARHLHGLSTHLQNKLQSPTSILENPKGLTISFSLSLSLPLISCIKMLFFSYFKELVGREVTVELKNDLAIRGTLHSVDQYLNIKLENTRVVDQEKYPHMLSVRNCFIRGSVVRYVQLPPEGVDVELLHDATRREARGG
ncbi:hypothetical protein L3X38_022921 [Prunus dulcis]|uniref:Sm domain-containing protein n=5 Tax=Prunus TaxID=3754 RepID=A0AAD4VZM8_PRUDU|nr:hypothetical protein L3X38_022921 [Prunus dulcis]